MNAIDLMQQPAISAMGWALLHFVWQGALIGVLAALALTLLRRSAPDVRYVVATIALSLMFTLPVVTALQIWRAPDDLRPQSQAVDVARGGSPDVSGVSTASAPGLSRAASGSGRITPARGRSSGAQGGSTAIDAGRLEPWLPLLVIAWLVGVVTLTLRLMSGWLWVQRLRTRGTSPAADAIQRVALRLMKQLHLRTPVQVLQSTLVDVPTVVGWIAPVVLVPISALAGLAPHQLEAVLAHELAHIRRHDYLVNLLQTLVETLLFFHPAVWWLSRQIRLEREHCCDDLAVSLCGDPLTYARALADLEVLRSGPGRLVLAANGGSLLQRVRRLVGAPSHSGPAPGWLAGAAAVVVMVAVAASAASSDIFRSTGAVETEQPRPMPVSRTAVSAPSLSLVPAAMSATSARPPQVRFRSETVRVFSRKLSRTVGRFAREMRGFLNSVRAEHAPQLPPLPPIPPAPPEPVIAGRASTSESEVLLDAARAMADRARSDLARSDPAPADSGDQLATSDATIATARALLAQSEAMSAAAALAPSAGLEIGGSHLAGRQDRHGTFSWSNNGDRLEVKYDGEIEFTDDDADVKRLSPGGLLRIKDGGWLGGRTAEFTADASGSITRRYWAGLSEKPFDPEGRQWLAQALPRFIRQSGIGAPARVARFLKAGGSTAVLAEITRIDGSFSKRIYFKELLRQGSTDAAALRQILEQAGREIESDFELASLLIENADVFLANPAVQQAYFEAARTIQSDFEMHRVYGSALKRGPVSSQVLAGILESSRQIESDFEEATLLIQVAKLQPLDQSTRAPFFAALATVASDFEHRRVLSALAERTDLQTDVVASMLESAMTIRSDFECASLLLQIARQHPIEGSLRAPFFRAVDSIQSAFERGRVLQAVAGRSDASTDTLLGVLRAAKGMGSSFETSQVLLRVASGHTLTGESRDAYIDAAEKLGDFEQGRALAALVRSERRR